METFYYKLSISWCVTFERAITLNSTCQTKTFYLFNFPSNTIFIASLFYTPWYSCIQNIPLNINWKNLTIGNCISLYNHSESQPCLKIHSTGIILERNQYRMRYTFLLIKKINIEHLHWLQVGCVLNRNASHLQP